MKRLVYITLILATLTSCAEQCNIAGNSSVGSLDGKMLYLRVSHDGLTSSSVDSCEVIHGRFSFFSNIDSIIVAQLYMGNESLMPVVLENGDLNVEVDHVWQRVSGGPLNERLYKFMQKKNRIENMQWELDQKCMRMMHEGHSPEDIRRVIAPKATKLAKELENLEVRFIKENYENPLGPGCFMWLFSQYPLPIMTEQIERIVKDAPQRFLCDPFVNNYLRRANINSQSMEMNGETPAHTIPVNN